MIRGLGKDERRTLLLFLLILTTFIVIASSIIYINDRRDHMLQATLHAEREIELIGKLITEALIKRDYATVEQFIGQWTLERPDLVEVKLTTANGFVLARHVRTQPAQYRLPLSRRLAYGDQSSVTVDMVWDMATVHQRLNRLLVILAAIPTVLIAVLLLFLWWVLRRTLLQPLHTELQESEQYNRMLFEQSPIGLALCRMNGELVDINSAYARIIGRSVEETLQLTYWDITPESYATNDQRQLEILKKTGRYGPYEKEYCHKDGHLVPVRLQGLLLKKDGEQMIWSSVEDITERKQIVDELRKHRDHLEELVDERTAELHSAQEELLRKQRLASIGQLTATVSHELRNPLGSIRNSLAVIRHLAAKENPMMKNAMEITERGISRCDNIINELLDFARIRELKLETTDIDAWLGEVLEDYDHAPEIELICKPGAGVEVACDRERLLRALLNVLNNACDAVTAEGLQDPARTPQVTVTTRTIDDRVEIEIADNGPGMPAEQQEKIFEPLFSTKSFGVGLGMPVVKQVMEQHGGSVHIDSNSGHGARVRLLLPVSHRVQNEI